jgi:adenylosuccinate lyase
MPHKRNPVTAEKVCGLSRVVRALVAPVTEGIALWHERDLSHSSVERICVPLAATLTEHQALECRRVFSGLVVDRDRMLRNLRAVGGTVVSARLRSLLVDRGIAPETADRLLRDAAREDAVAYVAEVRRSARELGVSLPEEDLVERATADLLSSAGLARAFTCLDAAAGIPRP